MIFRWAVYGLASWLLLIGLWTHDWRMIVASVATWLIFPLVTADLERDA